MSRSPVRVTGPAVLPHDRPAAGQCGPVTTDVLLLAGGLLAIGVEPPPEEANGCPGPERVGVWADPTLTPAAPPAA